SLVRHAMIYFASAKSSSQAIPTIGHVSPQFSRELRRKIPSHASGVVNSKVTCCQSFVPRGKAFDAANTLLSVAFATSIKGGPPLRRFSVRIQKLTEYFVPGDTAILCQSWKNCGLS